MCLLLYFLYYFPIYNKCGLVQLDTSQNSHSYLFTTGLQRIRGSEVRNRRYPKEGIFFFIENVDVVCCCNSIFSSFAFLNLKETVNFHLLSIDQNELFGVSPAVHKGV